MMIIKRTLAVLILVTVLSACNNSEAAGPAPTTPQAASGVQVTATQAPTTAPAGTTEAPPSVETVTPEGTLEQATTQPDVAAVNPKLNLNEATGEDFQAAIPNLGSRMVREFMEYRPYVSIQQFRREIGKYVDQSQVAGYEQYVYVPVNVNEADAETLGQLPGVDETVAAELITARPYESNEAFLAKLGQYVSAAELAAAQVYLVSP